MTEIQKELGTCRCVGTVCNASATMPCLIAVWPLAIRRKSNCKPRRGATQLVFLGRAVGVLFLVNNIYLVHKYVAVRKFCLFIPANTFV